jgi:hypothetical protein
VRCQRCSKASTVAEAMRVASGIASSGRSPNRSRAARAKSLQALSPSWRFPLALPPSKRSVRPRMIVLREAAGPRLLRSVVCASVAVEEALPRPRPPRTKTERRRDVSYSALLIAGVGTQRGIPWAGLRRATDRGPWRYYRKLVKHQSRSIGFRMWSQCSRAVCSRRRSSQPEP